MDTFFNILPYLSKNMERLAQHVALSQILACQPSHNRTSLHYTPFKREAYKFQPHFWQMLNQII